MWLDRIIFIPILLILVIVTFNEDTFIVLLAGLPILFSVWVGIRIFFKVTEVLYNRQK